MTNKEKMAGGLMLKQQVKLGVYTPLQAMVLLAKAVADACVPGLTPRDLESIHTWRWLVQRKKENR